MIIEAFRETRRSKPRARARDAAADGDGDLAVLAHDAAGDDGDLADEADDLGEDLEALFEFGDMEDGVPTEDLEQEGPDAVARMEKHWVNEFLGSWRKEVLESVAALRHRKAQLDREPMSGEHMSLIQHCIGDSVAVSCVAWQSLAKGTGRIITLKQKKALYPMGQPPSMLKPFVFVLPDVGAPLIKHKDQRWELDDICFRLRDMWEAALSNGLSSGLRPCCALCGKELTIAGETCTECPLCRQVVHAACCDALAIKARLRHLLPLPRDLKAILPTCFTSSLCVMCVSWS